MIYKRVKFSKFKINIKDIEFTIEQIKPKNKVIKTIKCIFNLK